MVAWNCHKDFSILMGIFTFILILLIFFIKLKLKSVFFLFFLISIHKTFFFNFTRF